MKKILYLLFAVFSFYSKSNLYAQRYNFTNYNISEGLVQSQALTITQDHLNRLWIGTMGGVSIFDGTNFMKLNKQDGLVDNYITSIDFDSKHNAWIATANGVSFYNGYKCINYKISEVENVIFKIIVDNKDRVWVFSNLKLYMFNGTKFIAIEKFNIITTINKDLDGQLIVGQLDGEINRYENKKWVQLSKPTQKFPFLHIQQAPISKTFYAVNNRYLYKLEGQEWKQINDLYSLDNKDITNFHIDHLDKIWISTNKSLYTLTDNKTWINYNYHNGYTEEATQYIFEDNEKNIWLGTNGGGIFRYRENPFVLYDREYYGLTRNIINSVKDSLGVIYLFTSKEQYFTIDKNNNFKSHTIPIDELKTITIICLDNELGIIISTDYGVYNLKNNKLSPIPSLVKATIFISQYQLNNKNYYGSTNGLAVINNGKIEIISNLLGITAITKFNHNTLILGAVDGIYTFNIDTKHLQKLKHIEETRIQAIVQDNQNIYIATDDKGLMIYNKALTTVSQIQEEDGLSNSFIFNLLIDAKGNLWLGTGNGIDRIKYNGPQNYQIKKFGRAYGLNGAESNVNASILKDNGTIYFGTTKGLFKFDPKNEEDNTAIPKVILQDIKQGAKSITNQEFSDSVLPYYHIPYKPTFPHDKNNISFTFKGIYLTNPDGITYKYKLKGAFDEFIETKNPTITFSNLAPGQYSLIVYASDENGRWYNNALTYDFTINAAFYQTIWFEILIALLVIAIIYGYIWYQNKQKQRKIAWEAKLREEEQNKVRVQTAADFHDEIGNKLTRINLLTNVLEIKTKDQPEISKFLVQIRDNVKQLYNGSKDIIWTLQPESDYLQEVLLKVQQNCEELLVDTDIKLHIFSEYRKIKDVKLNSGYSRQLVFIFKEALNNAIKYGNAKNITLKIKEEVDNSINFELSDDGKGFDVEGVSKGNGLINIANRAKKINGELSIISTIGMGTLITLKIYPYSLFIK